MPEERVKRTDYFQSQPIPTPPNQAYQGHFRAESVDVVDDGYDHDHEPHQIGRSDSRTPLTPPHDTNNEKCQVTAFLSCQYWIVDRGSWIVD
ncbi:hypothetical protein M231_02395 [Tremella mesenterica]|uniref:Uncharacterized protein n=1 Tax=Tremella mesenterica TaxID=5217 RepID=A0A4Q1BQQ5_TREME|nr:hypothetical protein M231_02395 [Tremella mesenterica]